MTIIRNSNILYTIFSKKNTFLPLLFLIQKLFYTFAISSEKRAIEQREKIRTDILTKHLLLFRVKPICLGNKLG